MRSDVAAILFDEPLTVIDPHLKWRLRSKLKELHQRVGLTMIYVTHDQTEALTFADQVVVMNDGQVVQAGTPVELFERPRHTFVGHFIGSPGMNVLPCEVDRTASRGFAGHAGRRPRTRRSRLRRGKRTEIGVRPEFVRFADSGLPVRVERVSDGGRFRIVDTRAGEHLIKAADRRGRRVPAERGAPRLRAGAHAAVRRRLDRRLRQRDAATKTDNQKAWWLVLPVVLLVAFNAVIPLMAVVNYSVQETFGNNEFFFEGVKLVRAGDALVALPRGAAAPAAVHGIVLAIEIPLGVAIALAMPRKGIGVSVCLVLMAMPLLIPWNVVGAMWNIFALPDIGLLGWALNRSGSTTTTRASRSSAWITLVAMDVWHWTSLVVLLAYAGLVGDPRRLLPGRAHRRRASPWAIFRYIQLPKMKHVLMIAVLLRFMDSFMIYTEAVVLTGGGPGNATTLLSIDLVKIALGQFDLGPAAAMSLIYFLIILLLSWLFYTVMTRRTR